MSVNAPKMENFLRMVCDCYNECDELLEFQEKMDQIVDDIKYFLRSGN